METATYTNEQIDAIIDKYPLLGDGYASLECPDCDTLCFPERIYKNGTVRYNAHKCQDRIMTWNEPEMKSFSNLENGDLKGR